MSRAAERRNVVRAEDYRRFQGYISQQLESCKRWSRYESCTYLWMYELIDHPKFFPTIKYFLKEQGIESKELTETNVSELLSKLNQEAFVQHLIDGSTAPASPPSSSNSVLSDTSVSSQSVPGGVDEEASFTSSNGELLSEVTDVQVHLEPTPSASADVGIQAPVLNCRPLTAQIKVMNLYSDRVFPVTLIAEEKTKNALVKASQLPLRDFDFPLSIYSPVNISSNASLLRLGKENFVIHTPDSEGIKFYGLLKYYNHQILHYDPETSRVLTPEGSADNIIDHWLQGHHHIEMDNEGRLYYRSPSPEVDSPQCSRTLRNRSVSRSVSISEPIARKKRRKK